jgi:hypothetical protein
LRHGNPRHGAGVGYQVRAGLHTGECELRCDDIGGIAVHIGARVSALTGPNDVLVSSTLRDLVIGSGLEFEDRGAHELEGVPGAWHLFAVTSAERRVAAEVISPIRRLSVSSVVRRCVRNDPCKEITVPVHRRSVPHSPEQPHLYAGCCIPRVWRRFGVKSCVGCR